MHQHALVQPSTTSLCTYAHKFHHACQCVNYHVLYHYTVLTMYLCHVGCRGDGWPLKAHSCGFDRAMEKCSDEWGSMYTCACMYPASFPGLALACMAAIIQNINYYWYHGPTFSPTLPAFRSCVHVVVINAAIWLAEDRYLNVISH